MSDVLSYRTPLALRPLQAQPPPQLARLLLPLLAPLLNTDNAAAKAGLVLPLALHLSLAMLSMVCIHHSLYELLVFIGPELQITTLNATKYRYVLASV